jgi:hypothetical protein
MLCHSKHATGFDVQLLDAALEHLPPLHADLPGDRHECCIARRELELVDVAEHSVPRLNVRDEPVRGVVDGIAALAVAVIQTAVPPGQNRPPAVSLHPEVGHSVSVERKEPDDPATVVEDERSRLHDVLLRGDEDVAGSGAPRLLQDLDRRRLQVRS